MSHAGSSNGRLKRPRSAGSCETNPERSPAGTRACYLARGSSLEEWHVWNASSCDLNLRAGDVVGGTVIRRDFESGVELTIRALSDLSLEGSSSRTCELGREIRFRLAGSDLSEISREAASQEDLIRTCASKGVECALFLRCHLGTSARDEELELGAAVHSAFVASVKKMLSRKYDIMHHYALFNRAIGLYYAKEPRSAPPADSELTDIGGWLDESSEEHVALHGIDLVGEDHASFSRWNYPAPSPPLRAEELSSQGNGRREEDDADARKEREDTDEGSFEAPPGPAPSGLAEGGVPIGIGSPAPEDGDDEDVAPRARPSADTLGCRGDYTYRAFNNFPGTLTDGPKAFPYAFTVRAGGTVRFDDLVNYCVNSKSLSSGPLPARERWGSINPVLIMEDPVDETAGKVARRYTVTSRGYLSSLRGDPDRSGRSTERCYNEVFLPGRPVSRLNLDVDLKCCRGCSERFSAGADGATKVRVSRALVSSAVLVITESLLRLAKVKRSELRGEPDWVKNFGRSIGKIAAYQRNATCKSKLTLRLLWYLPTELCSFEGIDAYRGLLEEMEKTSLAYALLSYPSEASRCGLCELRDSLAGGALKTHRLRLENAERSGGRRSAVDRAPYAIRKSVRLPNCYKEGRAFKYVGTFNSHDDIEDPRFEHPSSLSVGLSSNPITSDVTSLGARFADLIGGTRDRRASRIAFSGLATDRRGAPTRSRVESEARRLAELWGVPVTVKKSGSGLSCVEANERSETYPCPFHNRIHSKNLLRALVFDTHTAMKCFVP